MAKDINKTVEEKQEVKKPAVAKSMAASRNTDIIRKGKYRVFNGSQYETIHLQTTAEQVIESDAKKFVSQTEKNTWNSKADGSHRHDDRYYQKTETYTQAQIDAELQKKASVTHSHQATEIVTDTNKMFVSKAEKDRWNDTYTKGEINTTIEGLDTKINTNEASNAAAHSKLESDFKAADKVIADRVTGVSDDLDQAIIDLTALINNGGDANAVLAGRIEKVEKEIPTIKGSITSLDSRVTGQINDLADVKADKTQVAADIEKAKSDLNISIAKKADKTYVDTELGKKADKETTYTKTDVDSLLAPKTDKTYVDAELAKKVDVTKHTSDLALKADKTYVDTELGKKADTTFVNAQLDGKSNIGHTHKNTDISGLGTASTRNVGTSSGQIPTLDVNGKLDQGVLPKIAINETFEAASIQDAMLLTVEVGDIVILTGSSRSVQDIATRDTKAVRASGLNDEYVGYIAAGSLAYICVDSEATTFEGKFKPLQSVGDTISKAEVMTELNKKVDKTVYETFVSETKDKLDTKANKTDVYTKTESNDFLSKKVDKVSGKGLSTNDFTTTLLNKLNAIEDGANKYIHPTGDGNSHVPSTGTSNNGRFLMAGASAGAMAWTSITANHITQTTDKKFVSEAQITEWNSKSAGNHNHDSVYRKITDSLSTNDTKALVDKMKTIVSESTPALGTQAPGAVWIEVMA